MRSLWINAIAVVFVLQLGLPATGSACGERGRRIGRLNIEELDRHDPGQRLLIRFYEQVQRGEIGEALELLDRDVQWTVEGVQGVVPFAGTFEGRRGVDKYFDKLFSSAIISELYARFIVQQDDMIHVHFFEKGIARTTGKVFEMEIVQTWVLQKGKLVNFREFNDTYAMHQAYVVGADPADSLVQNTADYGLPDSSYPDPVGYGVTFYQAQANQDLQYFLDRADPNLVWILAGPTNITPFARTYYGPAGIIDFFTRIYTTETYLDFGFNYIMGSHGRADAQFFEKLYVYSTGKVFTCQGVHTFIVNDAGKMTSFRSYNDTYSVAMGFIPD